MIATGPDLAAISRQVGHAMVQISLAIYAHFFARRIESGLGANLEALIVAKRGGCVSAASGASDEGPHAEVIDFMVARGGIEPPTRGFSVRCSTN